MPNPTAVLDIGAKLGSLCHVLRDDGDTGRWRKSTRQQIADRGDNLDLNWLKDDNADTPLSSSAKTLPGWKPWAKTPTLSRTISCPTKPAVKAPAATTTPARELAREPT